jgi:hypothetical protein
LLTFTSANCVSQPHRQAVQKNQDGSVGHPHACPATARKGDETLIGAARVKITDALKKHGHSGDVKSSYSVGPRRPIFARAGIVAKPAQRCITTDSVAS